MLLTLGFAASLHGQDVRALADSAWARMNRNDSVQARASAHAALDAAVCAFGPADTTVASMLELVGTVHSSFGEHTTADSAFAACEGIRHRVFGGDHVMTWAIRATWANMLVYQRRPAAVLQLLEAPLQPYRSGTLVQSDTVAMCLGLLASAYTGLGRFNDAEQCYDIALHGPGHGGVHNVMFHFLAIANAGWFLLDVGRAREAVSLLEDAIASAEKLRDIWQILGRFHCIHGEALHALGRTLEAEQAYRTALRIFRESPQQIDDVTTMANLAVLKRDMGCYDEAERLLHRCLELMDDTSPEVGRQLGNLAGVHLAQGRFIEAENECRRALAIQQRHYGREHFMVARTLLRLGVILRRQERLTEADSILGLACDMGMRVSAPGDGRLGYALLWRARVSLALGATHQADSLLQRSIAMQLDDLHRSWTLLTEKEKSQFHHHLKVNLDACVEYAGLRKGANPALNGDVDNLILACKGIVQQSTAVVREHLHNAGDTATMAQYRAWLELRARIAFLAKRRDAADATVTDSLALVANGLERRLTEASAIFASAFITNPVTWRDVLTHLGDTTAAVEIVRHTGEAPDGRGAVHYAALILRGDRSTPPEFVPIPGGDSLETTWLAEYQTIVDPAAHLDAAERYRRRVRAWMRYWAPLASHLKGIARIHLSCDGVFHLINPDILSPDGRRSLFDLVDIRRTTSTRLLASAPPPVPAARHAVLLGAPDFGAVPQPMAATMTRSSGPRLAWQALRFSRREILGIDAMLRDSGWTTSLLVGIDATKRALASIDGPGILHISTHAYVDEDTSNAGSSLLRDLQFDVRYHESSLTAGLALAGANRPEMDGMDDGVLTAYEAATLDLQGTALVVLSACETGMGRVRNGEGVYGLQRAFQLAGARTVVMSLWKVDDGVTRALMTEFYRHWLAGRDAHAALREAVTRLRAARPWLTPADWGAFVVVE